MDNTGPLTGVLIDISTDAVRRDEVPVPVCGDAENSSSSDTGTQLEAAKKEVKLCGYLSKVNQGGLIKGSKRRWFVFDKATCTLNWYRSPKDAYEKPIGSIPISSCVFTCTAEGLLANSFLITHGSRTHILQAPDQRTMLWWIQELQAERRMYNVLKPATSQKWLERPSLLDLDNSTVSEGLLNTSNEEDLNDTSKYDSDAFGDSLSMIPVLPRVENPPETVGEASAKLNILKPGTSFGLPLDIGNKVVQIGGGITKLRPRPPRPAPPSPASVFYAKRHDSDGSLTLGPTLEAKKQEHKHKKALEKNSSGFHNLIDRLNHVIKTGGKSAQDESRREDDIRETLHLLREEMELMKASLDSRDETIGLLKRELNNSNVLDESIATGNLDGMHSPAYYQITSENTTLKLTVEHLREEINEIKALLNQEQEKARMFQEMLEVKDGVVVKLTNELHHLGASSKERSDTLSEESECGSSPVKSEETKNPVSPRDVKDEIDAYRQQNKFLNSEILELTRLRKVDSEKIDFLHEKSLNQEALRCQLQSKYFILLSEMDKVRNEPDDDDDNDDPLLKKQSQPRTLVQQLIRQAIQEEGERQREISAMFRANKYDKYGFLQIVDDADESTFLSAASRLQQTASNIFNSIEQHDESVSAKWHKFMSEKELQRNAEFKALVRLGIPHELRHKVWSFLVHARTHEIRQQLDPDGNYYKSLCDSLVAPLHAKQIDLDLLRTLPSNHFYSKIDSPGIQRLKRVLGAYSLHNPGIGYCQGLNRVAAIALLYLSEEDTFWCLVAIVECIMPQDYYTSTLTASQADQRVFRDLLAEKLPSVYAHLDTKGIDVSLITFNWFLCIFCDGVPPETMFNIWDVLLNESSKVLFRFALAFFKHIEDDIIELQDYMTLFNLLRKMVHRMYDARELKRIAFQDMNPFPMRKIDRLRANHIAKVQAELHQLDVLRSEFASKRVKSSTNSDICSDDEGEND